LTETEVRAANERFRASHPSGIVRWAADTFGDGLIMTSSLGAESMCAIHLAIRAKPDTKIVVVNTGYLFAETLEFMARMRARWGLSVREYHTRNDPVVWLSVNGEPDPRQRRNVDACCAANKNEVFDRAMAELSPAAWLRGVRADQSAERARMEMVQWSPRNRCWAISPLLHWTARDIHQYMKQHGLEYHPLWEKGYSSIGCNPGTCTRPIGADQDQREGRWAGLGKKECGIHLEG